MAGATRNRAPPPTPQIHSTIWDQLFPAEQARILQLLVARVAVRLDGLEISLRVEGITSVVEDLRLRESTEQQAA